MKEKESTLKEKLDIVDRDIREIKKLIKMTNQENKIIFTIPTDSHEINNGISFCGSISESVRINDSIFCDNIVLVLNEHLNKLSIKHNALLLEYAEKGILPTSNDKY